MARDEVWVDREAALTEYRRTHGNRDPRDEQELRDYANATRHRRVDVRDDEIDD